MTQQRSFAAVTESVVGGGVRSLTSFSDEKIWDLHPPPMSLMGLPVAMSIFYNVISAQNISCIFTVGIVNLWPWFGEVVKSSIL